MIDLAIVLWLALAGRIKGGFLAVAGPPGSDRNFWARAVWAGSCGGAIAFQVAGPWWLAASHGVAGVLLAWVGGNADRASWQNLGEPGHFAWAKVLKGAGLGVWQYGLLVLPICASRWDPWPMAWALLGLLQPLFYWIAWRRRVRRFLPVPFGPTARGTRLIDSPNAWAEIATHLAMGLAIKLA